MEIRDIRDELGTIQKLFTEQHSSILKMLGQYEKLNRLHYKGLHGIYLLREADQAILGYEHQVTSMLKSAEVAQEAVC